MTSNSSTPSHLTDALNGDTINVDYLNQVEAKLTSTELMAAVKASIATRTNAEVEQIAVGREQNPENVKRLEAILSASDWDFLFPHRAPEYTYLNMLKAVGKFPALCGSYSDGRDSDAICRKTLATMFAHFTQETGGHTADWDVAEWRQGLVHVREMGWTETMRNGYNGECNPSTWQGQTWPCGTFGDGTYKSYFGRGAKQLSYNYNYGPFSEAMYGDVRVLLDNPELVADSWLNLASAVFFYVYPQPPKPSMLFVVDGTWQPNATDIANGLTPGFGVTTQIINGGVECGGSQEVQQSKNRIAYYQEFANYLAVPVASNEVLGCKNMKQFDAAGAGALNIYWEEDFSYVAENPDGKSFACKLVGYQTPYSAFHAGDYAQCVAAHFKLKLSESTQLSSSSAANVSSANTSSANISSANNSIAVSSIASLASSSSSAASTGVPVFSSSSLSSSSSSSIPNTSSVASSASSSAGNSALTTPGAIALGWLADTYTASSITLELSWNMWWGENGNHWYAYVDGAEVYSAALTVNGQNAQSGATSISLSGSGSHQVRVELCNQAGAAKNCSSATQTITLGNTSASANNSSLSSAASSVSSSATSSTASSNQAASSSAGAVKYGELNNTYSQTSGKVIVSYYVEWGVYGRNYHVNNIPAKNITHLLFGFLAICGDNPNAGLSTQQAIANECANKQPNEVTLVDRFADLEKTYPGDTWYDDVTGQNYNGNFGQLRKLKLANPHLKILPSIGGWTMSTPFYAMAKDDAKRAVFVNSAIAFIKKYDFFDGLDIDWEYPVFGGTDPDKSSYDDRAGYTKLMRDLRAKLNELAAETGRQYQLTSAVSADPERINAVDYAQAIQYMDYTFAMTYDFGGAWESTTSHHAALFDNKGIHAGFNAADAVTNLLAAGVPSQKIVVGAAFYGRGWTNTRNTGSHAPELFPLYGTASAGTKGTWEASVFDYRDLYNNYIGSSGTGINGFSVHYDTDAEAPYLWNASTGEFITYDDPRSIAAKAQYVKDYNLGGILSWELDADNGLLLNAINEGLGNSKD